MGPSSDEPGHLGVDGGNPATCLEELYWWCEGHGITVSCGGAGGGRWAAERDTGARGGKRGLQAADSSPGGALGQRRGLSPRDPGTPDAGVWA